MKILCVNIIDQLKPTQHWLYPLSFGYLKSYAEHHGEHHTYRYTEDLSASPIQTFKPDIIALTSITENYPYAVNYARLAKTINPATKIVIGGVHISAIPESLDPSMDIGIVGEGEQTWLELAENNFAPSTRIDGLAYWQNGQLIITRSRQLIEPLDSIPHPDRTLMPNDRPSYVFTSRGCSYRCRFCFSSRFWRKLRLHSARYVYDELAELKRNGVKHVNIYDDCFVLDVDRAEEIARLVKPLGLSYSVAARANLITEKVAKILSGMNVVTVGIGFESNSQRILDIINKGNTITDNQNAINILRKHGIHIHSSFIRGIPGENKNDLKATFKFITHNQLSYDFYWLMRYPATPFYEGSTDWRSCRIQTCKLPFQYRVQRRIMRTFQSQNREVKGKNDRETT